MAQIDHTVSLPVPARRATGKGWFHQLGQMMGLWRQRRHLGGLDDAALCDIGLTRNQAITESERPLWDVPSQWLR